jgi:hypothetical protein
MPPGNNAGGNLNLFLFEVGMITRDPLGLLPDIVRTVAIHPLVVVPTSIAYTDESRGSVTETHQDTLLTRAGRKVRRVQMVGNFGVETRGLALFVGTGQLRFEKFWHEVVRLADATNQEQVDASKNLLRSPFLNLALGPYDPDRTTFYVNFFDFWNDVEFEVQIPSFSFRREHRGGGASGLVPYTLNMVEAGPIVTGSLINTLINGLFDALTAWDDANELLKSFTLDAIVGSLGAVGGIFVSQFEETQRGIQAQIDGVRGLMSGFVQPGVATITDPDQVGRSTSGTIFERPDQDQGGFSTYLTQTQELAGLSTDIADAIASVTPSEPVSDAGEIKWSDMQDEGSNRAVESVEAIADLYSIEDASLFQQAIGALYGMGRAEFQDFLDATGRASRPANLSGSITYRVSDIDIPESLEQRFGVSFESILAVNRLTPDEALIAGREIQIPRERVIGPQSFIDGLPVFGSHTGRAAWGSDLTLDLDVDADGDLVVIEEEECLQQGVSWIITHFSADLLELVNADGVLPIIRGPLLRKQIARILLSDKRVAGVEEIRTETDAAGRITVQTQVIAINGGTVSTAVGGPR